MLKNLSDSLGYIQYNGLLSDFSVILKYLSDYNEKSVISPVYEGFTVLQPSISQINLLIRVILAVML